MPSPLKFNFPELRPSLERLTPRLPARLPASLVERLPERWRLLVVPLGVALGAHALWLLVASLGESKRVPVNVIASGDDTPELLRFSKRAAKAAGVVKAPNLSMIPLPLDSTLPPPPPDLAFPAKGGTLPPGPKPELSATRAAGAVRSDLVPAERSSLEGLPSDPLVAFKLAVALADIKPAAASGTEGNGDKPSSGSASTGAAGPASAGPGASSPAATAIARRHLKLNASTEKPFLLLWQQAKPLTSRPEALTDLPEGVEVRSLPLAAAKRMGIAQPQGLSLSLSRGLLLLWVDGDDLWLIQQKA